MAGVPENMRILVESMTRVPGAGLRNEFTIRVWRQEKAGFQMNHEHFRYRIRTAIEGKKVREEIADAILAVDSVNAVEVVDIYGDGLVYYKDWP